MRRLAEGGTEKAMEVKFKKTGLSRRLLEQNTGLVFGSEEATPATEPTESVVMEKLRHQEMIYRSTSSVGAARLRATEYTLGRSASEAAVMSVSAGAVYSQPACCRLCRNSAARCGARRMAASVRTVAWPQSRATPSPRA